MLEFAQRLAIFDHGQVIGKQDVNGGADRRHLQFDGVEPQLLYRASAANAAVADESDRLVAPFSVGVIERVFQDRGRSAIVFGSRWRWPSCAARARISRACLSWSAGIQA